MNPNDRFLRPAQFGLLIGVTTRTVMRYIRAGMPCLGRRGHARPIPVEAALTWLSGDGPAPRGRPRNVDRLRASKPHQFNDFDASSHPSGVPRQRQQTRNIGPPTRKKASEEPATQPKPPKKINRQINIKPNTKSTTPPLPPKTREQSNDTTLVTK